MLALPLGQLGLVSRHPRLLPLSPLCRPLSPNTISSASILVRLFQTNSLARYPRKPSLPSDVRQSDLETPSSLRVSVKPDDSPDAYRLQVKKYWSSQTIQPPSISRAVGFLLAFGAISFGSAAYFSLKQSQNVADLAQRSKSPFSNLASFFTTDDVSTQSVWGAGITEKTLQVAKKHETAETLGRRMEWLMGWCDQLGLPTAVKEVIGKSYISVAENYLNLPTSKQVVIPVIVVNTLVFAAWRLAAIRPTLERFLTQTLLHRPSSQRVYTMLTSTFSHRGGFHFLFNNVAAWSFGGSALIYASHVYNNNHNHLEGGGRGEREWKIPESSMTPHFISFFATAGVFAATVSHIATAIRFRRVSALKGLEYAKMSIGRQSSLGSSGAVYSALVMSAFAFPEAQLSLILLPFITIPIGIGVGGLVTVDVLGILFSWRHLDHWAHLGGAIFGYLYYHYGVGFWELVKFQIATRLDIVPKNA